MSCICNVKAVYNQSTQGLVTNAHEATVNQLKCCHYFCSQMQIPGILMPFLRVQILAHPAQIQPQKENTKENTKERKETPSADVVSSLKVFTINMFTPSMTIIATHTKIPCLLCSSTFMCMITNKKAPFCQSYIDFTALSLHFHVFPV